jgi:ATP-binding protein involved in chromosome partitioning
LGSPFLGEIPLDLDIRVGSDGGVPIVVSKPDSPQSRAFQRIADELIASEVYAEAMR